LVLWMTEIIAPVLRAIDLSTVVPQANWEAKIVWSPLLVASHLSIT
jgi:hypothetical protein